MIFGKTDFFQALKESVMFSQSIRPGQCGKLQAFKVLEQGAGGLIRSENLGGTICDKGKPYFWSRRWHESSYNPNQILFDFPILCVVETGYTVDRPFDRNNRRTYQFNISVLDKYVQTKGPDGCTGCDGRTINEIYEDTEAMLFQALSFVSRYKEAEINPSGETGFFNINLLDAWKQQGSISGYNLITAPGDLLVAKITDGNAYKAAISAEGLFGNAINLNIGFQACQTEEFTYNSIKDFGTLSHEAGCTGCK